MKYRVLDTTADQYMRKRSSSGWAFGSYTFGTLYNSYETCKKAFHHPKNYAVKDRIGQGHIFVIEELELSVVTTIPI